MSLTLYNTLTKRKDAFQPIDPDNVRMYVCGPTVYDLAHIGNARPVIVFDVLFRMLRHTYGAEHVTYVRNITDVDDKINARAANDFPDLPLNEAIRQVTSRTEKQFHDDIEALGVLRPTVEPRATEHIEEMKRLCAALVERGHAYVAEGHVLFHVASMPDYGQLSNRTLEEMEAGARVEVAPYKRDPMDFVLWKPSKPGEPAWPSPCGIDMPGRPGWHIECSAMSEKHLGPVFDIHGGGIDLVFPHHENEIAQSRCAHGTPVMANVWMHNGFLQVEGEKMSKSLGNFITINELLAKNAGDIIRFQMLQTHYRQPIDWTNRQTQLAREELYDWAAIIQNTVWKRSDIKVPDPILSALSDDLNTPAAFAELRKLYSAAKSGQFEKMDAFSRACSFLGFQHLDKPGYFDDTLSGTDVAQLDLSLRFEDAQRLRAAVANGFSDSMITEIKSAMQTPNVFVYVTGSGSVTLRGNRRELTEKIQALVDARIVARKAKDFKESDRIRDELAAMGVQLKDAKDPKTGEITTSWEVMS